MEYTSNSPQETFTLGKRLGEQAKPGEVYCLDGDLGVGKTIFTQGFAAGLGIDEPVNSPTFTIVQQYEKKEDVLFYPFQMEIWKLSLQKQLMLLLM